MLLPLFFVLLPAMILTKLHTHTSLGNHCATFMGIGTDYNYLAEG